MNHYAEELRPIVEALPPRSHHTVDVVEARRSFRALIAGLERPDSRIAVDVLDAAGVPVRCYRPAAPRAEGRPLVVYMHGGGFAFGSAADAVLVAGRLVPALDATVVSVDYRLAPEHPFPAGADDCYTAFEWASTNAGRLGCDPMRLAVMGPSAGACLAASTALRARDRRGPPIALQVLQIPALDDRRTSHSARTVLDPRVINSHGAHATWSMYLGAERGEVSPYAAPLRATDLSGLPPAYVQTCEIDPYRDDGLRYAQRLLEAGVSTELYNVPGAFHAFDLFAPDSQLAQDMNAHWMAAMRRALVRGGAHEQTAMGAAG